MGNELIGIAVAVVVFTLLISVFGGGALLYVGARFAAKIPGSRYWKCVGVYVVSGLVGGVAGGAVNWMGRALGAETAVLFALVGMGVSLLLTWVVIMGMFQTTFGKAVLAWLPTLGQFVLVVPLLVAMLMPGLSKARELARRASCKSNVSAIGKAIAIYTAANRDVWPADLDTLIRDGQSPGIFVCPSSSNTPGSGKFSYVYVPGTARSDSGQIVLCDYKANHKDGYRTVLYADLHVGEFLTEDEFQQYLTAPFNAPFAKALRAAEGP